ncbi:hypothetical protein BU25DRAFT_461930 [Macroventuria anomochaeta]|uniref:Uncharacterized protein n=1 Tax=Macroventuria anomochaeta TaxID=301207 RepID=A0ACB6RQJ7_9PLEO|nr:uncharacterized protein BU25DRAFT_461930 [Macroventuria anomochaeta]KAF2623547.1 hypothetical protein BU25DRAFT_461930 [Macroventuria anomochaeta]
MLPTEWRRSPAGLALRKEVEKSRLRLTVALNKRDADVRDKVELEGSKEDEDIPEHIAHATAKLENTSNMLKLFD